MAQASLTHAVDVPQADAETEAQGSGAQQPDQSLGFESKTRPASEAEEALAAEPNSHVTDERSVDKALGELSAEELAEAELAEGAKVPAEPSVFDEDGMEAFTLSAGDRIGGGNPGLSPARGGRNNAKRGAASESLFGSAKRGLSALMPKKDTRPVDEVRRESDLMGRQHRNVPAWSAPRKYARALGDAGAARGRRRPRSLRLPSGRQKQLRDGLRGVLRTANDVRDRRRREALRRLRHEKTKKTKKTKMKRRRPRRL